MGFCVSRGACLFAEGCKDAVFNLMDACLQGRHLALALHDGALQLPRARKLPAGFHVQRLCLAAGCLQLLLQRYKLQGNINRCA